MYSPAGHLRPNQESGVLIPCIQYLADKQISSIGSSPAALYRLLPLRYNYIYCENFSLLYFSYKY